MPGVIVRGGAAVHPELVNFDRSGLTSGQALNYGSINSEVIPYRCVAPGSITAILIRAGVAPGSDVTVVISKNGTPLLTRVLLGGQTKYEETLDIGDFPFVSLDELSCRIVGTVQDISVQLKLM